MRDLIKKSTAYKVVNEAFLAGKIAGGSRLHFLVLCEKHGLTEEVKSLFNQLPSRSFRNPFQNQGGDCA